MSNKPKRTYISHMEQLIEFPVGTLICHASFMYYDIFMVTGWVLNTLEAVRLKADAHIPDGSDPRETYYFSQSSKITIIGEAAHEF